MYPSMMQAGSRLLRRTVLTACEASSSTASMPATMGHVQTLRRLSHFSYAPLDGLEHCSTCFIPTTWYELPLLEKQEHNHDSTLYTIGLPDGQALNLPTCACILMNVPGKGRKEGGGAEDWDGTDAVRPYTPVSGNVPGKFDLLVKRYDGGAASQWLHGLDVGATIQFKHIPFNIKAQYPFEGKHTFTFVCAGTGITPMYQALHKLLGTPGDNRKITMIYGNKSVEDILMKEELDAWAKAAPDRLKLIHVIGATPDAEPDTDWVDTDTYVAETGWIDQRKIEKYAFSPSEDTLMFVCGLPDMYGTLCGPRTEPVLAGGTVLPTLGYKSSMVAKM